MRLFMILTLFASSSNNGVVAGSHFRRALNRAILNKLTENRVVPSTSSKRELQQIGNAGEDICTSGGVGVVFDEEDTFEYNAFTFLYETECDCTEDDNTDELDALFDNPTLENITDFTIITDTISEALSLLEISSEYSCENRCESCFGDNGEICGLLSTSETTLIKGNNETEITLTEILELSQTNLTDADGFDFTRYLGEVNYQFEVCMAYTMPNYGKLCFGADIDEVPESAGEFECYVNLDGVDCNNCTLTIGQDEDTEGCAVADCSNIPEYGATIDTCNNQGLSGPFQIIAVYQSGEDPGFQKGECGVIAPGPESNSTDTTPAPAPSKDDTSAGTSTISVASMVAAIVTMIIFSISLM